MARGAIANKWDSWVEKGILAIIPKGIEDVGWDEIKSLLRKT